MRFFSLLIFSFASLFSSEIQKLKIAPTTKVTIPKLQKKVLNEYSFSITNKKITPFYIAKYETSVKEYMHYLKATSQTQKLKRLQELEIDNEPVTNIDFDEASKVCKHFQGRLPTELEWIVSASVKTTEAKCYKHLKKGTFYPYPTSEFPLKNPKVINCLLEEDEEFEAELVGSELNEVSYSTQNLNGTYGMLGNVWEWVDTDKKYFKQNYKLIKGGSFANSHMPSFYDTRISNFAKRDTKMQNIGFRCAWDVIR